MTGLTIGQVAALRAIAAQPDGTAHESNTTNAASGLIHWQPLNALIRKGLVEAVPGQFCQGGRVVTLTDSGRKALRGITR